VKQRKEDDKTIERSVIHRPFGTGFREQLEEKFGFNSFFEVPIVTSLSVPTERGTPFVLSHPNDPTSQLFECICERILKELKTQAYADIALPLVQFVPEKGGIIFQPFGESEHVFNPTELRMRCRGAHTIDEISGKPLLSRHSIPHDLYPESIDRVGNYAIRIVWSHGHGLSLYPYTMLKAMMNEHHMKKAAMLPPPAQGQQQQPSCIRRQHLVIN
jgi:DUF971 family protein